MGNLEGGVEGNGDDLEAMESPEQRERKLQICQTVVLKRLGTPRAGEEEQNQQIANKYAADVLSRLTQEGVDIPENVDLAPEEDRLILCTLSNIETDKTHDNLLEFMGSIIEGKQYNFKAPVSAERIEELTKIAVIFQTSFERIKAGWDTSEWFTEEEAATDEVGEYPADQVE